MYVFYILRYNFIMPLILTADQTFINTKLVDIEKKNI